MSRNLIFLYAGLILITLLVIGVILFSLFTSSPTSPAVSTPTAVPTSQAAEIRKKVLEKVDGSKQFSPHDATLRKNLITPLKGNSGILYQTKDFSIVYLSGTDIFQIRLLSANLNIAKEEGLAWFKAKGFTQSGICNLPVLYYLSPNQLQKVQDPSNTFSPVPEGC